MKILIMMTLLRMVAIQMMRKTFIQLTRDKDNMVGATIKLN